jgi:SpoVK/Ycf46/Vps4 family AAA+-type ATPase
MNDLAEFGTELRSRDDGLCIDVTEPCNIKSSKERKDELSSSYCQWGCYPNGIFQATSITRKILPPNCYQLDANQNGLIFISHETKTDDLIRLNDEYSVSLLKEINDFWSLEEEFKKFGFLHKRGLILHGPAGGGKTCIVQMIIKDLISNFDGVVLIGNCSPQLVAEAIKQVKQVEANRKIICLFEDIDSIIKKYGESDLLSLLDGETQINNVLNIATTNYPEVLDKRIVSRPRRFDRRIKINMPSAAVREQYFQNKVGDKIDKQEIEKWVSATEGFSFAALTELIVLVKCLKNNFEQAIEDLRNLIDCKVSSDQYDKSKVGFKR